MCGLAGIAALGEDNLPAGVGTILAGMSRAVGHRGPDAEQVYMDGPVGLGFRRLALVGPESGDQPLFSEDGKVVLIANGEVYNHRQLVTGSLTGVRTRTNSDCEVLAHLYARDGLRFLDDVVGMFAIALWDRMRHRLVLARDRFGIKPLYYTRVDGAVLFASEIKALFAHPGCRRELDWEGALADQSLTMSPYLTDAPVNTWFRGIEIVPAGSIVSIDLRDGEVDRHQYWNLPSFEGDAGISDEEFVRTYRDLLTGAVRDAATADAELGLFLSGGIDSTAVAALAGATGSPIHTFTVLSGGTLVTGDSEFGHRAASTLGMPNHQLVFDAKTVPAVDEWKRLLWLLETPLCGPEQYYKYELYRYAKQARPQLRGMLLGAGADEYNGGFSTVFNVGADWAGFESGIRQMARAAALHKTPALAPWWECRESPLLEGALLGSSATSPLVDPYPAYVASRHRYLQQYNCWHDDRTAAGNGIEARVPFLDHRIIELLMRIPTRQRAGLLWDKKILREAVRDIVPSEIAARPKGAFIWGEGAGFTHRMVVRLLSQQDCALLEEALASPGARQVLCPDAARAMLGRLRSERQPADARLLLSLVNLGLLDEMTRQLPAVPLDAPPRDVLTAISIGDWDCEAPAIAERVRDHSVPSLHDVVAFPENVLLVQARQSPSRLYLVVDGAFEYVVDADLDAAWFAFLQTVDGERTLGELLDLCGQPYVSVEQTLLASIDAGLLQGIPA
ncbi:asparagine synthase (glutamine-hydrolyzing) [Nocardia sp. NPDC049190]|uniref:asparagine synthase (glutamine-hydrolyzing) n=1 Tax=Nocardia sp. NPDC049190 TaxID=3155650 RepID=UPI0033CBFFA7